MPAFGTMAAEMKLTVLISGKWELASLHNLCRKLHMEIPEIWHLSLLSAK
jgi:hypothetical protein